MRSSSAARPWNAVPPKTPKASGGDFGRPWPGARRSTIGCTHTGLRRPSLLERGLGTPEETGVGSSVSCVRQTDPVAARPLPSSKQASARFVAQREQDTQPELLLRSALHRRGLRYRLHRRPLTHLRRTVDIVFPALKVAVDVRGCFWHVCPEHCSFPRSNTAWWAAKLARNVERDRETEAELISAGWSMVIVWEHEDPEEAADRVEACVRSRRGGGLPRRFET